MFKYIISILVLSFACSSSASKMLFYKKPTAENLASVIEDFNSQARKRADLKSYRHQKEVMQHYLTLVFQEHPDFIDGVIAKMGDYSPQMQDRIAQSIANNGKNSKLPSKYQGLVKDIVDFNEDYKKHYNSQNDIIHDVGLTDLFWMSYFVTGNEFYIEKILKFATSFSIETRKAAYEILDREQKNQPYDDIKSRFSDLQFYEVQACEATLKSITYNRQQYRDINDKVKALIQRDDYMNYAKGF